MGYILSRDDMNTLMAELGSAFDIYAPVVFRGKTVSPIRTVSVMERLPLWMKLSMHDFGIVGMTIPQYDPSRCAACVKGCRSLSVNALRMENYKVARDSEKCIGCGVCVTKCPTRA